ncbi:ABC transporter permease [Pedobacter sandarakinus]|uniref:ABC transporter permease n=1 Tax=Pedobacter sandarakinus TaxID=353156 RepID=UPI00224726E8|nr:ABC transporter permease [Pedobacter sandarakinus]MCX2574808.1 ABC transporter permease [Pedobacter sandarakinus]
MFKLNLKIALRNLWKYKGYTAINVFGLSIGLASCILIFIFIKYQLSFDQDYANEDRIYRVVSSWKYADGNEFKSSGVPLPLAPAMRNDFSELEQVAAIQQSEGIIKVNATSGKSEIKDSETVYYAEPSFFKIFNYSWLAGDLKSALTSPNTVVLTEKLANKYFGNWNKAIGNTLNFNADKDFKVSGVIKDNPQNSSFPLGIIFSYASFTNRNLKQWGSVSSSSQCFVLLKPGISTAVLQNPLQQFIAKYYVEKGPGKENHHFQSLSDIHHNEDYGNFSNHITPYKQIIGLAVIGLFLLITACINFVNLATAQALSRGKEVGVRKVMGSRRNQLIWQFLCETALITAISILLACVFAELTLPNVESLFGGEVVYTLFGDPLIFLFLLILLILVSFLAGLYPALIMSGFSPALAIKNKVSPNGGGVGLRKTLVVVQFAITAILIVSTLVVIKQMQYIRSKSLGFDTNAIALINMPIDSVSLIKQNTFKEKLLAIPGVVNVSFNTSAPSSSNNNETNFSYNSSKDADFQVNVKPADGEYFTTFGLSLVAGRGLSKSDTIKEFVVNETLLKKLNVKQPDEALGKTIKLWGSSGPIVGVVKDFNNYSLHEAISPIAIFSRKTQYETVAVKLEKKEMFEALKKITQAFNSTYPNYVFRNNFFDDSLDNYYETERVMGTLFKVFAGVVVFISFIGLFGLISFVATQRTKEIAIRKVLGATNIELIKMLNSSFLWMILIANLIAWPIAYIFVQQWLAGFQYRIELSIWPFVLAAIISLAITIFTVTIRSYRAAKANTVDALKYE